MKVVLTGGAGYIGSHILIDLLKNKYEVMVLDNFSTSSPETLKQVEKLVKCSFMFTEGSICNPQDLDKCFKNFKGASVIHCAGLKSPNESIKDPLGYFLENVYGSIELLKAMQRHLSKKIVFSSSAAIYGNTENIPIKEDTPASPQSPYARSKYMVEEIIKDWYSLDNSHAAIILRYFNPVGAHESGVIGESMHGSPNNLMPHIALAAQDKTKTIPIFGNDYLTRDGTGERDYIHISDLAEAHISALKYTFSNQSCRLVNIGTGRGTTVLELVNAFENATKIKIPYAFFKRRPGDLSRSIADVTQAKELLGWQARFGLEEMCKSTWLWSQNSVVS